MLKRQKYTYWSDLNKEAERVLFDGNDDSAVARNRPGLLQDTVYVQHYNMKYEKFRESLKIHAGGGDKLWIQFAPPNQ